MGCSFAKIQPKEPKKTSKKGKKGYKITPDNMRKMIKTKIGQNQTSRNQRRSLINYSYKNFAGNMDKSIKSKSSNVEKVHQKVTKKEEKRKIKKTQVTGNVGTMGSMVNFLSLQQIKKPAQSSSINKNALYFKSLPKEIKELRFQSLKVKEMEEISKAFEMEKRSFVRKGKKTYHKSYFSKFAKKKDSSYQDRTMPVMSTLYDFFEQEMEEAVGGMEVVEEVPKDKANFTLPRIQTTYIPSKTKERKNSEGMNSNLLMSYRFKDVDMGKVKPGASKSVDQNKSEGEASQSQVEEMDTSIAQFLKNNLKGKDRKKIQEYKNWGILFNNRHKKILKRKRLARSRSGSRNQRKKSHFGQTNLLAKDVSKKEKSVVVEGIVDDNGNTLRCGGSSYGLSYDDDSEDREDNAVSNSLYDSVYGLKGF